MNNMRIQENEIFHPRICISCLPLFYKGHYQYAALESMKQVELALRDKGIAPKNIFGDALIKWVLGNGEHITLSLPLGNDLQERARLLFKGAFGYYRNYAAHDGAKIDKKICFRVMVLASELLDLISASRRSYEGIGGIEGIIKAGIFANAQEFEEFLDFHLGQQIIGADYSDFEVEFEAKGFKKIQWEYMFDLGLLRYDEQETPMDERFGIFESTLLGVFELTDEGGKVLEELKAISSK